MAKQRKTRRTRLGQLNVSTVGKAALFTAVGAGVLWFLFRRNAGKVTSPTSVLVLPPLVLTGDTYVTRDGDTWSNVASRAYDDYRWWPALWDMNRGYSTNPEALSAGTSVQIRKLPSSPAYKKAVFSRAEEYRAWLMQVEKQGRQNVPPPPVSIFAATPVPVEDGGQFIVTDPNPMVPTFEEATVVEGPVSYDNPGIAQERELVQSGVVEMSSEPKDVMVMDYVTTL